MYNNSNVVATTITFKLVVEMVTTVTTRLPLLVTLIYMTYMSTQNFSQRIHVDLRPARCKLTPGFHAKADLLWGKSIRTSTLRTFPIHTNSQKNSRHRMIQIYWELNTRPSGLGANTYQVILHSHTSFYSHRICQSTSMHRRVNRESCLRP